MIGGSFGKYEIISTIGKGSMGVVFHAKDPDGREVALKLISNNESEYEDTSVSRLRFNRESRYAMELQHPNIVKTFDTGEVDNTLYLACELVEGGSLEDVLEKETFSELNCLKIGRQILRALSKINEFDLVHRDIKPGNILIHRDGTVKLSDLGLVRSTSSDRTMLTQQDNVVGTPYYLAPEQIYSPEEVDIRCDLYAVGVMMYECLAGHLPFDGEGLVEILKQHLYAPVPEITNVDVRKEVFDFLCDLMAKKPKKRPSSPNKALAKIEKIMQYYGRDIEDAIPELRKVNVEATTSRVKNLKLIAKVKTRMQQAKFTVFNGKEEHTIFIYGGTELTLGRNSVKDQESHVCLRLRPAKGNESSTRKISGQHCKVFTKDNKSYFQDTNSTYGSIIDSEKAQANTIIEMKNNHQVSIAKVIDIDIHSIQYPSLVYNIENEGRSYLAPAIFVERPNNGSQHSYALVAGNFRMGIDDAEKLYPQIDGIIEIIYVNKTLWLHNPSKNQCYALSPGKFSIGSSRITVAHIDIEDQK
ncbi:protein kinase [Candidatus Uabimicrobium sp. HlEnr_7]|uniref:serine/threonine protein kinase n=1 Tax=Candidatus Uabimicrobium helgolandensis TaxID=3095367 RepID=UPI0035582EB7